MEIEKITNYPVLRIRNVYAGSEFFHPGSRVKKIPVPKYFNLKLVFKLSEIFLIIFKGCTINLFSFDLFLALGSGSAFPLRTQIQESQINADLNPVRSITYTWC